MKVTLKCRICNKIFQVIQARKNTAKYCSRPCFNKSKIGKPTWVKGRKTGIIPRSAFRKGHKSWRKGLHQFGKESPNWRGGRRISYYIHIYKPEHPHANNRYVPEHRLIVEQHIGRFLTSNEEIHHINRNRHDNRIKNLYLFTESAHKSFELKSRYHKLPLLKSNLI